MEGDVLRMNVKAGCCECFVLKFLMHFVMRSENWSLVENNVYCFVFFGRVEILGIQMSKDCSKT